MLLFSFSLCCCCAALLVAAGVARGQMTIRDVPLNRTAAWGKHVAMLRDARSPATVPPLRIGASAAPAVAAPRAALPDFGMSGEWRERIRRASRRHGTPEALLTAVLQAESNFDPYAVSPKGALGAMQIMPATGRELGLRNFFDPEANLDAGAAYLAALLREFSDPTLALAAYNAGPAAVRRHGGLPPYEETRNYVARVLALFRRYGAGSGTF
jgi:soluble lytic murein transglycosylase-like protein